MLGCSGGLPLYRATDRWFLVSRALTGLCDLLHCLEQLALNIRPSRFAAAFIEPAAILKLKVRVEAKEVRGADGIVGAGNVLAFVMEIGKREAVLLSEPLHVVKGIVRIDGGIVGGDRHGADAKRLELRGIANYAIDHRPPGRLNPGAIQPRSQAGVCSATQISSQ